MYVYAHVHIHVGACMHVHVREPTTAFVHGIHQQAVCLFTVRENSQSYTQEMTIIAMPLSSLSTLFLPDSKNRQNVGTSESATAA